MDKAALDKNESLLPFVCGAYNDDVPEAIEAMRDIFAMARECLARRAADEGAVVVEGYVPSSFFVDRSDPGRSIQRITLRKVFSDDVPVSCQVRRRSVDPAGGDDNV